ncbi:restriction endonuclease [Sphingobium lactosutens]|nr:restriction endonuclease [Sphingobium lactosutens]
MDPLAFEELLLESFERRGFRVIRNHRYTGDGGIDRKVMIDGAFWLIQAKRYATAIRPEHVSAFNALCRARSCRGLFIHTGRTGPQSRESIDNSSHVEIISGRRLLALVTGGPIAVPEALGRATLPVKPHRAKPGRAG